MKNKPLLLLLFSIVVTPLPASTQELITVYSARKEHLIKPLFEAFTRDTGIDIQYLTGKANTLIERLKLEGRHSKADLFMAVDAGNLWYAGNQGLLQSINSKILAQNIPAHLKDPQGLWTGLSVRARTMVYSSERVKPEELSTYAALAEPQWQGRLCLRTAKKIYTKSLVASILHHQGTPTTTHIIKGWVANLAATPHAKDSQVMSAIIAGQCDVGLVNTYYFAHLLDKNPSAALQLFWANQDSTGVHVNISGAGVTKYANNVKGAIHLLEWLSGNKAQTIYTQINKEYPANLKVSVDGILARWGDFKQDQMNLSIAGKRQVDAVILMQRAGYK